MRTLSVMLAIATLGMSLFPLTSRAQVPPPLEVTFNFPVDGGTVYGRVPLSAKFSGAWNVDAQFSVNGTPLSEKATDVGKFINGLWDTTGLAPGQYAIKLDAKQTGGDKTDSATVNVTLSKNVYVDADIAKCRKSTKKFPSNIFGLNHPFGDDTRAIEEMEKLGVRFWRRDLSWKFNEPEQGVYTWGYMDDLVKKAHDAGIKILATPGYVPDWVNDLETWDERYDAYQAFVQAAVLRYKPGGIFAHQQGWTDNYGISGWEMMNEVNLDTFGWKWTVNPEQYTLMLAHANAGVRAADSKAWILYSGLANTGLDPKHFLEYSYILGAKNCFDTVNFHPYGYEDKFQEFATSVRELLAKYGDGQKAMCFTEYGTTSNKNRTQLLTDMWEQRSAAQCWFWFTLQDSVTENWGFLDANWEVPVETKQEAYDKLKELLEEYNAGRK